jgi:Na+-translocating ferredoxin:NAD+ oxidoreductase RnfA subunit
MLKNNNSQPFLDVNGWLSAHVSAHLLLNFALIKFIGLNSFFGVSLFKI